MLDSAVVMGPAIIYPGKAEGLAIVLSDFIIPLLITEALFVIETISRYQAPPAQNRFIESRVPENIICWRNSLTFGCRDLSGPIRIHAPLEKPEGDPIIFIDQYRREFIEVKLSALQESEVRKSGIGGLVGLVLRVESI